MIDTDDADDHPIEPPAATGWRHEPPTFDEFKQWPYWWIRCPRCAPVLLGLGESCLLRHPEDLAGALWTPAVPPELESP